MVTVTSFYLSRIIGNKIWTEDGKNLGKLKDLVIDAKEIKPLVIAAVYKKGKNECFLDFSQVEIYKEKGQYVLKAKNVVEIELLKEDKIMLVKHILDKQIVDINGRKVVRVNDIRLANLATGVYVVAVDIGVEGILRRLGLAKPIKRFLKPFGKRINSKFILWDEVEPIVSPRSDLKLSTTYSKLATLHPSDLADIIEELDKITQMAVFTTLDENKAAVVLEELNAEAQRNVLESLPLEKAADLLEKMPADEIADILDEIRGEKAEQILNEMEKELSQEVKELMGYPENTVGSLMTTEFIAFKTDFSVEQTINELRRLKPPSDTIYYLYVVDNANRLSGIVSLRDLVIAEPDTPLAEIMNKQIIFVYDTDNLKKLVEVVSKYDLLAIPVINGEKKLLGVVLLNDLVYEIITVQRKRKPY
ncbi:magnesium transporter MgtE N-terminal domain-containing protein [Carboxydothermus pertinax]|uniref:Magnesium transporter MgtE n=1 Tax=Carboxydothermus pertinax TaxID=870242 RepID=A0A1L8CS06_9THEO|nr:CBS domain-containing protein [Carboxydothermus pertinax]GAV21700.1 magnesium transporter MgtE [Carboxydothermus pertinax]